MARMMERMWSGEEKKTSDAGKKSLMRTLTKSPFKQGRLPAASSVPHRQMESLKRKMALKK